MGTMFFQEKQRKSHTIIIKRLVLQFISFYISNVMNMCNIWPQYAKDKIGLFVCINLNQIFNSDKNFYFFFRRKYILNYSSVKCISSASDICFSSPTK